jgi:hypothetical protein
MKLWLREILLKCGRSKVPSDGIVQPTQISETHRVEHG